MATDFKLAANFIATERIVDVSDKLAVAKVVREGFQVPQVALNAQAAAFFLDNLEIVTPRLTPRVVSQSIKPGTKVTAGTVVDLILAPSTDIPFSIFDNVHADLRQRNVATLVDGILQDAPTRQTLLKYEKAADVPAAERTALTQRFQSADIGIDDNTPDRSFEAAFNSARGALAFK
jgi:hypothetical protein